MTWGCWSWSTHSTLTSSIWWNIDDLTHSAIIRFKLLLYDKYLQNQTSLQISVTAWQLVLMTDIAALQCALSEVDLIQKNQNKRTTPTVSLLFVVMLSHFSTAVILSSAWKKKITTQKHWCTSERFINLLRVYKARWFTHWEACGCSGLMQAPSDGAGSGCIYASVSHQACFNWPLEATCLASTLIIAANTS